MTEAVVRNIYKVPSGNYATQMTIDGGVVYLGTYKTIEEAEMACQLFRSKSTKNLRQVSAHIVRSFMRSQKKRIKLLSLVPDQFTPEQAVEVWKMSRAAVDAMTQKMRWYNLIVPNERKKGRIFTKVKDQECKLSS
jgi:hypothetical protein